MLKKCEYVLCMFPLHVANWLSAPRTKRKGVSVEFSGGKGLCLGVNHLYLGASPMAE